MPDVGSLKAKVSLDTVEFNKGVKELSQKMQIISQDFKLASGGLDKLKDAAEISRLKITQLTGQIEGQKKIVDQFRAAHQKASDQFGEGSKQALDYEVKLKKAEVTLQSMERQLKTSTAELKIQSSTFTTLSKKMEDISKKANEFGTKMTSVGKNLSMGVTLPIVGLGVAAVKLASDLSENMNKVDVSFKDNADEVKIWSDTTLESFGISKGSALEMASLFGDMASGMDINTKSAADMSTNMVGLAGDLASFKNIGLDQASNALKGIFTGEGESLKSLGVIMLDSTLAAFALETGQKTLYKNMDQGQKVMLRYEYVLSKTKNSQGDFARTSDGTANQMRIFGETMKELGASMGQYILPVITPLIAKLSEMAQAFGKLDEGTKKTILVIAGLAAAIGPLLIAGGAMATGFGAIAGVVAAASLALGGATAATLAAGVAAGTTTPAIAALAGTFGLLTWPIVAVVAAVALLAAGGVLLANKLKQEVIPATNLFGDETSDATKKAVTSYMDLDDKVGVSLLSFQANNTKITTDIAKNMVSTFETMGTQIKAGRDKHYTEDLAKLTKFYTDQGTINSVDAQATLAKMKKDHTDKEAAVGDFAVKIKAIYDKAATDHRELTQKEEDDVKAIKDRMQAVAIKALTESEAEQLAIVTRMRLQAKDISTLQASEVIKNSAKQRDETTKLANDQYEKVVNSIARQRDEGVITSDDQAQKMIAAAERTRSETVRKAGEMHTAVVDELGKQNSDVRRNLNDFDGSVKTSWQKLKEWFANNPLIRQIITGESATSTGKRTTNMGRNATGTNNWRGGLTRVNEKGGEIMNLPRGTQIIPHDISLAMAKNSSGATVINFNFENKGTIVGSNGMKEFAKTVSTEIARTTGLAMGGAW